MSDGYKKIIGSDDKNIFDFVAYLSANDSSAFSCTKCILR